MIDFSLLLPLQFFRGKFSQMCASEVLCRNMRSFVIHIMQVGRIFQHLEVSAVIWSVIFARLWSRDAPDVRTGWGSRLCGFRVVILPHQEITIQPTAFPGGQRHSSGQPAAGAASHASPLTGTFNQQHTSAIITFYIEEPFSTVNNL